MCECWFYADLSQASAAQLLIRDGRDGAFLVRQSESVPGAYAICLMYHQQVHTYRVLPEENGLLSVQSAQGVEVRRFSGLCELISAYRQRGNGLVTALHHPVDRERMEKAEQTGDNLWKCSCWKYPTELPLSVQLDNVCIGLDRETNIALDFLRILTQLFGHMPTVVFTYHDQISTVDKLIHQTSEVLQLLSDLENKVIKTFHECVTISMCSPATQTIASPEVPRLNAEKANNANIQQHVQQNEERYLRRSAPENLSIFVGTWNMGGTSAPRSLVSWFSAKKLSTSSDDTGACRAHDLYMIGTQENPQPDREWAEYLRTTISIFGNYKVVCSQSVGAIKLVVIVKEEYEHFISHVQTSALKTRISNTLGIRGAVGMSFEFNGTSLGFITCHLVSGVEKVQKRNQSYGEILNGLALGDETLRGFQLPLRMTHLFWAGDLNYKLDMPVQDILQCIYSRQHQLLSPVDQLNQEREKKKIFLGFKEEPITFPPTCRYERGSCTYDLQKAKMNGTSLVAPSWSDRILWTSYPETKVRCTSYDSTDDIVTSDHFPVFATFHIGLNYLPQRDSSYTLRFLNIESIVKTQSRSRAYIVFKSLCLKDSAQSNINSTHSPEGTSFLKLGWSDQDLPEISVISGPRFTGHLLLNIRPTDGGDSFGECCVSVFSKKVNPDHHQFEVLLSHRGEETGYIRGKVAVIRHQETDRSPNSLSRRPEKALENLTKMSPAPGSPKKFPTFHSSKRLNRPRPASICCGSYSNAEYFLFEGLRSPSTPTAPRPHSEILKGEPMAEHGGISFGAEFAASSWSPSKRNTSRNASSPMKF